MVNGYWHLAQANSLPSLGSQVAIAVTPTPSFKETVMAGPHQLETDLGYWRVISDSILEHRAGRFVIAFNGHFAPQPRRKSITDAAALTTDYLGTLLVPVAAMRMIEGFRWQGLLRRLDSVRLDVQDGADVQD